MYVKIEDLYKDAHNGFIAINKVVEWYKNTEAYKYFLKITVQNIFSDLVDRVKMYPNLNYDNDYIIYYITETSERGDIDEIKESLEYLISNYTNYECLAFDVIGESNVNIKFKFRLK